MGFINKIKSGVSVAKQKKQSYDAWNDKREAEQLKKLKERRIKYETKAKKVSAKRFEVRRIQKAKNTIRKGTGQTNIFTSTLPSNAKKRTVKRTRVVYVVPSKPRRRKPKKKSPIDWV